LQTLGASQGEINRIAAEAAATREKIGKEVGHTRGLKEVGEAYDRDGVLAAAKEVASQAPGFVAGSAPQLAEMAAGAGAGALAGSVIPGVGTGIGALAGSFMALYPQFFSQNIAEQSAAMQESGIPKDIGVGRAAAAAGAQAALESAGKGFAIGKNLLTSILGKIPTEKAAKALATKELVTAAESTLKNVGKGVARGSAEEAFVNPAQDIMQRWQAGEDLFSKEAIRGYGESMYQGAVAGAAMGPAAGVLETKAARNELAKQGLDNTGAPIPPPSTGSENTQQRLITNEQGQLVPNPLATQVGTPPVGNAAPAQTEMQAAPPAAPIPAQAQQSLFAPEEINKVTPDVVAGQTEAGKPIEVAALDEKQRAQSEIERNIFALEQEPQTAKIKEQIDVLKEQLVKGPGETLDVLKQEFGVLGSKGEVIQAKVNELITQRDAAPTMDAKLSITEQLKPLQVQLDTIINRQQELLKEGAKVAKGLEVPEPVKRTKEGPADLWEASKPSAIIDDKILEGLGVTKKAPIRKVLRGLDMNNPADREVFVDEVNKHTIKGANINDKAVGNYFKWFTPTQETQNAGDTGAGPVNGTNERGIQLPSAGVQTTEGTTPPEATGVGSPVGVATPVDGGEGVSGADGNVALNEPAQAQAPIVLSQGETTPTAPAAQTIAPSATPAVQAQATPAQGTATNAQLFQAAGGKTKPSFTSKVIAGAVSKFKEWENAYNNNQLISTQMFGKLQNLFSFDDAFSNRMRSGFMELARKGDITLQQAKDAMLRASITQALFRSELAHKFMSMGNLSYDALTNRWSAVSDEVNMGKFEELAKTFATRTGVDIDTALAQMSKAYEANRVMEFYDALTKARGEITRTAKKIKELSANKKRTKAEDKELDKKHAYLKEQKKIADDLEHKTMHMTRQQALVGMQLYNANPEIKAGTEVFNTMRERAIGWMVKTGAKTQDEADRWLSSMAYVPFQRIMEDKELSGLVISNKGIRDIMTDPRMKGSMLEVDNTVGNMYQWMQWAVSRSISNQQLNVMLDSYKSVAPEEVREGKGSPGNTFTVFQDGVKREYHVANPAVAQAFIGAQSIMFPSIGALRSFKTAFTHAFTRLPLFPTAQLVFKDTWEAMFTSGLKQPWMLLKQIPAEILKTAKGTSEARQAMSAAGVLSTHDTPFLGDANDTATKLNLRNPNAYRKIMRGLDKWAALNDNMLRQAVYAQTKAEGGTHAEAMEKAVEVFNFRRQSGNVGMQVASQIIPFMNAFGQMQRITVKTLSGSGLSPQSRAAGISTLATTSAVLGMLSFAYAASVSDDDDYKKMNRTQRDSSFVIPGSGGLRIPVRMGLLTMPKLVGEYLYHAIADKGYTDPQMFKTAMAKAVQQQFNPPLTSAVSPVIGLVTNHDFFYDREIVNATQRRLAPERQFNKNTTELSKVLGKETGISPLKLDYFFKSYLGQYATLIALSNNSIAEGRGVSRPTPEHPTKDFLMNLPGVGSFVTKDGANGALSDFYEAARDVDTIINTTKSMAKSDIVGARAYWEKNKDKASVNPAGLERALGNLNTAESIIRNMPDTQMSPNEKAAKIKQIEQKRESISGTVTSIRQKLYNGK
jgi:Large polyvalent protein associated domain 38